MNFSLHLQTIFTFIRQNKANSQERNNPYTYTRTVLDICLLCTWTQRPWICFGWKVYWKHSPCTYTYIHISRAVKLSDVANTRFLPFVVVTIFLSCLMSGPDAPTSTALSRPLCSSASGSHLWEVVSLGQGKSMPGQEHVVVCLCCICSYWWATRQRSLETTVWRDPGSSAGQTSRRTQVVGTLHALKAPGRGVTSQVWCDTLSQGVRSPAILSGRSREDLPFVLGRCKNKADAWYHVIWWNVEAKTQNFLWNVMINKIFHLRSNILEIKWNIFILNSIHDVLPKKRNPHPSL